MILQNINGENKIFIDDSIINNTSIIIHNDPENGIMELNKKDNDTFNVSFNGEIFLYDIFALLYEPTSDTINFSHCDSFESVYGISRKNIKDNEIISLSLDELDNDSILISTMELPKFLSQDNYDEKYPKFEVNLSDCTYSMKIYINDSTYIDIPTCQIYVNIHVTLDFIAQLVYYLQEWRPEFLKHLCNDNELALMIKKDDEKINCGIVSYKLGEDGLYLTGGELENYRVEWNTFFKLIMDGKWEVSFKDE